MPAIRGVLRFRAGPAKAPPESGIIGWEVIVMRFRIRTLQVLIVLSAAPIWTLCEGVKAGCATPAALAWGALVALPLVLMCLVLTLVRKEPTRERVIALFGAVAIMGYVLAIPISFVLIDFFTFLPFH
jgi:hypothetical protein